MKKLIFAAAFLLYGLYTQAQVSLDFPFQGGKDVMYRFFKDSVTVSPEIVKKLATGTVIFKFTADQKGNIQKIIAYYADDASLTAPLIDAIRKSNHKWIIPNHEISHDYILTFRVRFSTGDAGSPEIEKTAFNFYRNRQPIQTTNQVPLDEVSLLPVIEVTYKPR